MGPSKVSEARSPQAFPGTFNTSSAAKVLSMRFISMVVQVCSSGMQLIPVVHTFPCDSTCFLVTVTCYWPAHFGTCFILRTCNIRR